MAFSELLQHVGNFGRFQIMISILSILLSSLITTHNLVQNFSAAIPAHRCYTQLLDNTTSKTKITMNLTDKDLLKISIPMGPNQKQEQCHRFRQTQWQLLNPNESAPNTTELEIEPCLDGWTYDRSVFTSTVVTQWDLVCDSWALKSLAQGIFALGYVVGSPISGFIADRLGRKPVLLTSSLLVGLLGICSVSAPTFSVYCTLRFFTAMSLAAMNLSSLALLVEWIPTSSRPIVMTVWALSFSTGQVLLGGLAYVFRDWHTLQLSISVPYLLFFLFLWKSSESARWLIVSGQLDKALKTLKDIAHFNGRQDAAESLNCEILQSAMQEELTFLKHGSKTMKIVTNPSMLKITCCLCFIRSSAVFFLYGLMFDLQNLGSNLFLSQILLGAVDFPTKSLSFFTMKYFKRRPSIACFLSLAGSSILVNIFIPRDIPFMRLGTALLGKGCVATFFSLIPNYNHELIPTEVRSTIYGIINFFNALAGALGPLVLITRQYFEHLPWLLFGTFPLVASICLYFLPETVNLPLPETIEDVIRRDKVFKKTRTKEEHMNDLDSTEC